VLRLVVAPLRALNCLKVQSLRLKQAMSAPGGLQDHAVALVIFEVAFLVFPLRHEVTGLAIKGAYALVPDHHHIVIEGHDLVGVANAALGHGHYILFGSCGHVHAVEFLAAAHNELIAHHNGVRDAFAETLAVPRPSCHRWC
jgi:hypothetical protein